MIRSLPHIMQYCQHRHAEVGSSNLLARPIISRLFQLTLYYIVKLLFFFRIHFKESFMLCQFGLPNWFESPHLHQRVSIGRTPTDWVFFPSGGMGKRYWILALSPLMITFFTKERRKVLLWVKSPSSKRLRKS